MSGKRKHTRRMRDQLYAVSHGNPFGPLLVQKLYRTRDLDEAIGIIERLTEDGYVERVGCQNVNWVRFV